MTALYAIPSFILLFAVIVLAVGVACFGQALVHRRFRNSNFVKHNDVAGAIMTVAGTLFAVVLGFVAVLVWQRFEVMQVHVALESASIADAWHDAVGLPQPARSTVRREMLDYAHVMVDDEWPLMRYGGFSRRGDTDIMDVMSATATLKPANLGQSNAQSAVMRDLTALHDARQERLADNGSGVSGLLWIVLDIGAIVVIGLCYLFGVERTRAHLLMTGAVAMVIASMFVLIFELQYPFRSDIGITPAPWNAVISHIMDMDETAGPMNGNM
jgi:hypothetical protein